MIPTISIYHNIYLTEEDKLRLIDRKKVNTKGVFIPTLHSNGYSNSPNEEYFCKYEITNSKKDYPILKTEEGWVFNLPQKKEVAFIKDKSYEIQFSDFIEKKFPCQKIFPFKRILKIKDKEARINQIHYIEIKSIDYLIESIEFSRSSSNIV